MSNDRELLFGNDLRLSQMGTGLDLTPDHGGDLDLAQGNDNIVQALTLRLLVRQGELARLGWPDYGSRLHELIGEPNTGRTQVKLLAFARAAIQQDPRVLKINQLGAQVLPGERSIVRLQMEILLIDQPALLNMVFDVNLEGR